MVLRAGNSKLCVRGKATSSCCSSAPWLLDAPLLIPERWQGSSSSSRILWAACLDWVKSKKLLWAGQLMRQLPLLNMVHLTLLFLPALRDFPHWQQLWWPYCLPPFFLCWELAFLPARMQAKYRRGGTAKHSRVKIWRTLWICRYDQHMGSCRVS